MKTSEFIQKFLVCKNYNYYQLDRHLQWIELYLINAVNLDDIPFENKCFDISMFIWLKKYKNKSIILNLYFLKVFPDNKHCDFDCLKELLIILKENLEDD